MFLIDKPYVSDFLKNTIKDHSIPIVNTKESQQMSLFDGTNVISENIAVQISNSNLMIYTNSENAIGWIAKNLSSTEIPEKIELFKDKFKFRQLISNLYPDFYYRKVDVTELDSIDIKLLPLPFIIKPSVGFFSMGVYKVAKEEEWNGVKNQINQEISDYLDLYPTEVVDFKSLIIEQCIDGDEFAIDAYFDSKGEPTILNILQHTFSSDSDVSDRVYTSSKEIIENNIINFQRFLKDIGSLANVTNFPCHIELRKDSDDTMIPIEINPMRFGGWCTTADFTYLAYGFNPYLYFYNQQKPDWTKILKEKEGKVYALIVLDNSTGIKSDDIDSFNYEKLLSDFETPLELREMDFTKYPVFGFLFTETTGSNLEELNRILGSDLTEYIVMK